MEIMLLKLYSSMQLLPSILAERWWMVVVIVLVTALLGRRVYCRFVCPLGILQSLSRIVVRRRRICSRLDDVTWRSPTRISVRSAVFAFTIAVGLAGGGWQWLDPYAICTRAVCVFFAPEFDALVAAIALVPAIVILASSFLTHGRVWCNHICPIGTLLSVIGMRPLLGDKVKKCSGCENCRRCFK